MIIPRFQAGARAAFVLLATSLAAAVAGAAASTPPPVVVAGLKIVPVLGDKPANFAKLERFAREAAAQGAKILVTSECFIDGYYGNLKRRPDARAVLLAGMAEPVDGPFVRQAAALARELSVHLLFGFSEIRYGRLYNSIAFITPEGEVAGTYSKSHVDVTESYEPGTDFPVFTTVHGRIGILVCYDRQLPETSRLLALKGAEIILVPVHSENVDLINEDLMIRVRAYENNVFVVLNGPFNSVSASPAGELLARRGPESGEGIVYTRIDLAQRDPDGGPIRRRHPEYYGELAKPAPGVVAPTPARAVPGLVGIVFDNPSLRKPVRVWTVAEPRAALFAPIARRDYSLTLLGTLAVPFAGDFEVRAEADDGLRLRLDGVLVIDGWAADGAREGRVRASAPRPHRFELEYYQDGGAARLALSWRPAGTREWQPVPASAFSHAPAERAEVETRFATLMKEYERVADAAVNPHPGDWPTLRFVQQGPRSLLRADFPDVAAFRCDAWMYESEMDFLSARDIGEGRLEVRHRLHADPQTTIVSLVSPGRGSIEISARAVRPDGSPAVLPAGLPPPGLCWQLRHAEGFRAFPEPYERFVTRCFVFTAGGRTFLDQTTRLPSARFPSSDPVNNPPWVQAYLPAWVAPGVRLPFDWAGVSPDRLTATVGGVVSRDGRYLAAIANDSATSISQVWIDCLHNDAEWTTAAGGPPTWRVKIYLMENDPDALLRRVAADFPAIRQQPAFAPSSRH